MNQDLRTALRDLANTGADNASAATLLAGRAANRVAALHRRRRVAVSALTIAGVTAAGAATAAAIGYFGHDEVSTFPDRPIPSIQAPAPLTGLQCGGQVGELTLSSGPLALGNELALVDGDTPTTIGLEALSIMPMFLTNTSSADLTFTVNEGSGVFLVRDGTVVAAPVRVGATPSDVTLVPDGNEYLLNDRVAACDPDAGIPAGDYQAYGSIEVDVPDGEHSGTYDVVGGPWDVVVPEPDGTVGGGSTVDLAVADPTAVFPQCGAVVDMSGDPRPVWLALSGEPPVTTAAQESTDLSVTATNRSADHLVGQAEGATFAVVRDGVVIGTADTSAADEMAGFELAPSASAPIPARLAYTVCGSEAAGAGWLPPGEYSVWGRQVYTVTERIPVASDGTLGEPVAVVEEFTALNQVAKIWIEPDGQPVIPAGP